MAIDEGDGAGQPEAESGGRTRQHIVGLQSAFSRLVATGGIIGIGTGIAAILGSQDVSGWVIGLVASLITLVLTAALWARTPARRSRV